MPGTVGAVWDSGNGSDSGQPMPPAPITDPGVEWQLPLAAITVPYHATSITTANIVDWRTFTTPGTAKSSTYVIASGEGSAVVGNADATIPAGSIKADDVINAALANVFATFGGGTVTLGEGTFYTSGTINIPSNVTLEGMGGNTIVQYVGGGAYPVMQVNNQTNATIQGMTINCGGSFTPASPTAPTTNADGIQIIEGVGMTVDNVNLFGAKNYGIYVYSATAPTVSYGHAIQNCQVSLCYKAGIKKMGNSGQLINNQVRSNLMGILLDGYSSTIGAFQNTILGNVISYNSQCAIALGLDGNLVQTNQIGPNILSENCVETDVTYNVLNILGTNTIRNKISGNLLATTTAASTKPLYGIYLDANCTSNTVTDNDCVYAAKMTGGNTILSNKLNIVSAGSTTSNTTPNWIRYNRSGSYCGTFGSGTNFDA